MDAAGECAQRYEETSREPENIERCRDAIAGRGEREGRFFTEWKETWVQLWQPTTTVGDWEVRGDHVSCVAGNKKPNVSWSEVFIGVTWNLNVPGNHHFSSFEIWRTVDVDRASKCTSEIILTGNEPECCIDFSNTRIGIILLFDGLFSFFLNFLGGRVCELRPTLFNI